MPTRARKQLQDGVGGLMLEHRRMQVVERDVLAGHILQGARIARINADVLAGPGRRRAQDRHRVGIRATLRSSIGGAATTPFYRILGSRCAGIAGECAGPTVDHDET